MDGHDGLCRQFQVVHLQNPLQVFGLSDSVVEGVVICAATRHAAYIEHVLHGAEAVVIPELPWWIDVQCSMCAVQQNQIEVGAVAPWAEFTLTGQRREPLVHLGECIGQCRCVGVLPGCTSFHRLLGPPFFGGWGCGEAVSQAVSQADVGVEGFMNVLLIEPANTDGNNGGIWSQTHGLQVNHEMLFHLNILQQ